MKKQPADTIPVVDLSPRSLLAQARTPGGRKMIRYSLVSVVSVIVSQIVLFVAQSFWSIRAWEPAPACAYCMIPWNVIFTEESLGAVAEA